MNARALANTDTRPVGRIVYLYAIVEAVADPLTIPPPPPPRAPDVVQRRQPDSGGLA
jgi:hypothetical protein